MAIYISMQMLNCSLDVNDHTQSMYVIRRFCNYVVMNDKGILHLHLYMSSCKRHHEVEFQNCIKATSWSTNDDITDAHISATIQQNLTKFSAELCYLYQIKADW